MLRKLLLLFALAVVPAANASATPVSVYGAWLCGNDACTWASARNMTDFDARNRWLVNRGDGVPSVNLVVLSFVQPLKLLNRTTDAQTLNGVPRGMTPEVVNYFKSRGVRVMLSIGGITYTTAWNQALASNAAQLGLNAAQVAQTLGVGIEIDYEENTSPNLAGLQAFINALPLRPPLRRDGREPRGAADDRSGGGRPLAHRADRKATADWLNTTTPVLDYANAMVTSKQANNAAAAQADWQEHIDGKAQYNPPIPPLAAAKFTGALYIVTGQSPAPECTNFAASLISSTGTYVQNVQTRVGTTNGMLGYMFWAAECPSRGASARPRRTVARAASASADAPTTSPSRCPRSDRTERDAGRHNGQKRPR